MSIELRDDIWQNHPQIQVVDFDIYSMEIFNHCENSNEILMAVENWKDAHPLLKSFRSNEIHHSVRYFVF